MCRLACGMAGAVPLVLATAMCLLVTGMHPVNARRSPVPDNEPKPGEEREFEIANGVKLRFCWIPSGKAQLGAPKSELEAVRKQAMGSKSVIPLLETETESKRGNYQTKGFWLAKYPVTQAEWKAVMGKNPSAFDGKKENKAMGLDTSRFPVEMVLWTDCQEFLDKLNGRGNLEMVFGKAGKFVLPDEDQWEYACRGGNGNKRTYYWGNDLNGTQANCNGDAPFGTTTKGPFLDRTCSVDFTNEGKYPKHPWGLCHMVGNVCQWCEIEHDTPNASIIRGGSWESDATECRSASRAYYDPQLGYDNIGFRICLRLEK